MLQMKMALLIYFIIKFFFVVTIVLFIICIQVIHKEWGSWKQTRETCIFDVRVSHFSIVGLLENRLPEGHSAMRTGHKHLKRNVRVGWYVC